MACSDKKELVENWEKEKQETCLTKQQESLLDSLVKKDFTVFLESYSTQIMGLKCLAGLK